MLWISEFCEMRFRNFSKPGFLKELLTGAKKNNLLNFRLLFLLQHYGILHALSIIVRAKFGLRLDTDF